MIRGAKARLARTMTCVGVLAMTVVVGVVGMTQADAKNFPHFRSFSVTLVDEGSVVGGLSTLARASDGGTTGLPDLLFTWTEVGVGNTDIEYELQTVVTATFGCVNDGSNRPRAANKLTVTAPLATTATLTGDQNGRISGSVVLDTSSVSTGGFTCPAGQTLTALSVTFSQNMITDTTNGVTATDDDIEVTF